MWCCVKHGQDRRCESYGSEPFSEPFEDRHPRSPQPNWLGELSGRGSAWSRWTHDHSLKGGDELMTEHKCFVFTFANVEVREREFCIVRAGEVLPVEPKAFRVLLFLLRSPHRLITKDEL